MEKKTKIILGVSLVVALLMLSVFVPEKGGGYEFIADIDEGVDVWRLVIQLAAVGCLAGIAFFVTATVARIMGFVLAVVVLLGIAVAGVVYFTQEYPKSLVSVSVDYSPEELCTADRPLAVSVRNRGGGTVEKVDFWFNMYEPGRSTELFGFDYGDYSVFDRIVGPGKTEVLCWKFPERSSLSVLKDMQADRRYRDLTPEEKLSALSLALEMHIKATEKPSDKSFASKLDYRARVRDIVLK